jgi:hypothetical protein
MTNWLTSLTDSAVQCWGCPVFDRLFSVISAAAAGVYRQFSLFCVLIFCIMLAFYILHAVWKNIRGGVDDPMYQKHMKPVLINSAIVFALLGLGVYLPRFITTVTFEPVAEITLAYTQSMIGTDGETVDKKVTYQPEQMPEDGFYRPELRNKIVMLMKTTITQFQSYVKLGIAVMDNSFSWQALTGIGALITHIMLFIMGLFLAYQFFKLFIRFCFYFVDIIVAMTFFAFFFPLSLVLFVFKNDEAPNWMKQLGKDVGADQFKKVIDSIITLSAAVLTYTVIMAIIAKFFSKEGASAVQLMQMITDGSVTAAALSDDNFAMMTLGGCIILVYVIKFIAGEVKNVTKMVLDAFDVKEQNELSKELADNAMKMTENIVKTATDIGKTALGIETKKDESKEEKKEEKK